MTIYIDKRVEGGVGRGGGLNLTELRCVGITGGEGGGTVKRSDERWRTCVGGNLSDLAVGNINIGGNEGSEVVKFNLD